MSQPHEQKLGKTKRPVPSSNLTFVPAADVFKDLKSMKLNLGLLNRGKDVFPKSDVEDYTLPNEDTGGKLPNPLEFSGYGQSKTLDPSAVRIESLGVDVRKDDNQDDLDPVQFYPTELKTISEPVLHDITRRHVAVTTKHGIKRMVDNLHVLEPGTGCVLNEVFKPEGRVFGRLLGKGSFGTATLYTKRTVQFVVKEVKMEHFNTNEVTVPLNLSQKNLTQVYGLLLRENQEGKLVMELVLEYAGISLNQYIKNEMTVEQIQHLSIQGLRGLQHLHLHEILHLDIKPENVCVQQRDDALQLKITDFGSAKLPYQSLNFTGWTPEYMAPETSKLYLQKSKFDEFDFGVTEENVTGKVDVFAFALVMMYMHTGYHILVKLITNGNSTYKDTEDKSKMLMLNLIYCLATSDSFVQQLIPDSVSLDMRELLTEMTHHDIERRATAKQALELIASTARGKIRPGLKPLEPRPVEPRPGPSAVKPSRKWHGTGKNADMFKRVHEKKGMNKRDACMAKNMQIHQKPLTQDAVVTSKTAMLLQMDTGTEDVLGTEMLQDSDTTVDLQNVYAELNQSPLSKVRTMTGEAGWQNNRTAWNPLLVQKCGTAPEAHTSVGETLDEVDEDDEMTGNLPNLNMLCD